METIEANFLLKLSTHDHFNKKLDSRYRFIHFIQRRSFSFKGKLSIEQMSNTLNTDSPDRIKH